MADALYWEGKGAGHEKVKSEIIEVEKIVEVEKAMGPVDIGALKTEVVANYADGVHASYARSLGARRRQLLSGVHAGQ